MSRTLKVGIWILWALTIAVALPARYPGMIDQNLLVDSRSWVPERLFGGQWLALESMHPTPPTFNYRESERRTGLHQSGFISLPVQVGWKTDALNIGIHSASKSSPAVDATGVYVGADSGWFFAFHHDGSLKWKFRTAAAAQGIHGTASLDESSVCFGSYNGRFYCLDKETGALQWIRKIADAVGSAPLIDGDFIYVSGETGSTRNGYLTKLRRNGEMVWATPWLGEQVHSSPALDRENRTVVMGANNGFLFGFNSEDGRIRWRVQLGGAVKGTPLIQDGLVYVTSWAKKLHALEIATGRIVWEVELLERSQSSPTYIPDSDILVVANHRRGGLFGIERRTGRVVWQFETGSGMNMGSGVAVRARPGGEWIVWITCFADAFCALEPRSGKVLQRVELGGPVTGVPAVHQNAIYVAIDEGPLVRLESRKP